MKSKLMIAVATLLLAGSALLSSAQTPGALEAPRAATPAAHGASGDVSSVTNAAPMLSAGAGARGQAPEAWKRRQNVCDTLSFYRVNPAYNGGARPTHKFSKYKRLFFTTGDVVRGWVPVYSAGQEYLHTGWVRGECLVPGWPYPYEGRVLN